MEEGSPRGFKIADAYVEVEARLDRAAFQRHLEDVTVHVAPRVEQRTRSTLGRAAGRGMLSGMADSFGTGFIRTLTLGIGGSGSIVSAFSSNPYVAAVGAGLAAAIIAVAAPAIGAGLAAAIALGGAGVAIAGGIFLIKDDPLVKKAASELGRTLFDIDTDEIKTRAQAAQEVLTAALKSGNRDRIREARANLKAVQKELKDAQAFNAKNFSLKDAAAPLIQPVVNSLGIFRDLIKDITPDLSKMFATLDPAIEPLARGLADMVRNSLPGFQRLIESSLPILNTLAQLLPILGYAFSSLFTDVADGGEGANLFFGDLLKFVIGLIVSTGKIIWALSKAYVYVRAFFTRDIPKWLGIAGRWFADLWDDISSFFSGVWDWISGKGSSVGSWFTDLWTKIGEFVTGVGAWFAALPGKVWGFLSSLPGRSAEFFTDMFHRIWYTVGFWGGLVYRFFTEMPGKIWGFLSGLPAKIGALWDSMWAWVTNAATSWWNATVAWLSTVPGKVGSFFGQVWSSVSGWFSRTYTTAKDWVVKLINDVVSWLKGLPAKAGAAVASLKTTVMDALKGAGAWLLNIGKDIVNGLLQGIRDKIGDLKNLVSSIVADIKKGFKDALEIGSPSKLMAREVGRWIPPGIAKGAEGNRKPLMDSIRGMVPDMTVNGRQGALQAVSAPADTGGGRVVQVSLAGAQFYGAGSARAFVAEMYDALDRYEKGYAR